MERGGDGRAGFQQFYGEIYDVNEGFPHSSAHRREASAGGFSREDVKTKETAPRNWAEKFQISDRAENSHQTERMISRSGVFTEANFNWSINSSAPVGVPAPADSFRHDLRQSWDRSCVIQPHPGVVVNNGSSADLPVTMAAGPSLGVRTNANEAVSGSGGNCSQAGTTPLFIGELHWWTTDADLEAELSKYGPVKESKFFAEKTNGKSKGYAKVEFYDSASVVLCKEGMNGHVFNGRPCIVSFSLSDVEVHRVVRVAGKRKFSVQAPSQSALAQNMGRVRGGAHITGNFGRGGGAVDGDNTGSWVALPPPPLNPSAILGQGCYPTGSGTSLDRTIAGYGGFPAGPAPHAFSGMFPSFPPVIAPHVDPSLFGRGTTTGGVGLWTDPTVRVREAVDDTIYRDGIASYQRYGEGSHGMDRDADQDWSSTSKRRHEWDISTGHGHERYQRMQYEERTGGSDMDREERVMEWERARIRERERDRGRGLESAR